MSSSGVLVAVDFLMLLHHVLFIPHQKCLLYFEATSLAWGACDIIEMTIHKVPVELRREMQENNIKKDQTHCLHSQPSHFLIRVDMGTEILS